MKQKAYMQSPANTETLVFYDGACPVCNAEMAMLRRWDRAQRLKLIDIAAPDYNQHVWPVSVAEMNTSLHVRLPDGTWQKGMAATRHIYRAVGHGWMLAFTGWPLLSRVFDCAYGWFARNRMPISTRFAKHIGARRCTANPCRAER